MRNLSCYIVDDCIHDIDTIKLYIDQSEELTLLGSSTNAMELLKKMRKGFKPDLLFLDIEMPHIDGMELAFQIKNLSYVIFITGHPQYGADAFDTNCIDFIRKPVAYARFYEAVNKAIKRIAATEAFNRQYPPAVAGEAEHSSAENSSDYLTANTALTDDIFFVFSKDNGLNELRKFSEVLYIEGLDTYIQLFSTGNRKNIFHRSLASAEEVLPPYFIRIHRSYIINALQIRAVSSNEVFLNSIDKGIPVGRVYKQNLSDFIDPRKLGNI